MTTSHPAFWRGLALGLLACVAVLAGGRLLDRPALPAAHAQLPAIAGGSGVYLMPGQLAQNVWGVYLMDTDAGTLMTYRYDAGGDRLVLLAARDIGGDRSLRDFNTFPPPAEVRRLADAERQRRRAADAAGDTPAVAP